MYTSADILQWHYYHCAECLMEGQFDCGCADAARASLVADLRAEGADPSRVWAEHVAWALLEYVDESERIGPRS